jgi:glycosyltransferase involved in cell wall biosynthesis
MKRKVSIILPTLNEEGGLKKTMHCLPKSKIFELGYDLEILVIDGGSTDLTRDIALQMGTKLIVEKQKGYGRAYTIGLKAASGDILVTLDADGTYPDELIPGYIQILNEKNLFYHNK